MTNNHKRGVDLERDELTSQSKPICGLTCEVSPAVPHIHVMQSEITSELMGRVRAGSTGFMRNETQTGES